MDFMQAVQAVLTLNADDALRAKLSLDQWRAVAPYFTRHEVRTSDLLIKQDEGDRALYLLGQGSLQVFVTGGVPGSNRIAILRPGSIVGEAGLFSAGPRMANVEAMTPCIVFALRGSRLDELAQRSPALAYELMRGCGGVMAVRMRANLTRQIPVC